MLRNIPKVLPPELVKDMMEMGHSDFLIIADANFPGTAHAKRLIRMDGVMIPELLEAILSVFPLDTFVDDPVRLMPNLPTEPVPEIWETYRSLLKKVFPVIGTWSGDARERALKSIAHAKAHRIILGDTYDTGLIEKTAAAEMNYAGELNF